MDKKVIGLLLIAILATVFATSLSYYVSSQPNQTQNIPSPRPTPTQEPTPTPTQTPAPSPSEEPTEPASTPKPSVPEFTLSYIDLSYSLPQTYGIDQYTGKTIITQDGYHVDNRSIQFTIKNQPFAPYTDPNGNQMSG